MIPLSDGSISNALTGRVVDYLAVEGQTLIIQFKDGQKASIGWYDGIKKANGEPILERLDFKQEIRLIP